MISRFVNKWKGLNDNGVKPVKQQIGSQVKQIQLENIGMYKPIKRADEKCFVFKRNRLYIRILHWVMSTIISVSGVALVVVTIYSGSSVLAIVLVLCLAIVNITILFIARPHVYTFIFDRMAGTLTIKRKKYSMVKPFESVQFLIDWDGFSRERDRELRTLIIADVGGKNIGIQKEDAPDWFSFYVWYMDRNRPLPPGTAFDLYRESDYERRKNEGLPEPLYPSIIKTPEWVGAEGGEKLEKYRKYVAMLKEKYHKRYAVSSKSYGR